MNIVVDFLAVADRLLAPAIAVGGVLAVAGLIKGRNIWARRKRAKQAMESLGPIPDVQLIPCRPRGSVVGIASYDNVGSL